MTAKEKIKRLKVMTAYNYINKNPGKNLPKILNVLEKFDDSYAITGEVEYVRKTLTDPDSNWAKLTNSLWTDIDAGVRRKLFETFVVNSCLVGLAEQKVSRRKYGCNIPWAILMDPTSACNLRCTGCWAAEYGSGLNLSLADLNSIINQGEELGVYFYLFSGGEPLVRKKDIIKLCEQHPECAFLAFTNGTLIDDEFADEMLRVKNFIPAISVEGFAAATDFRRGQGTYAKVEKAMGILKRKQLPFGISCCYTRQNAEVIGSEEYFDRMIDMGAKFCWLFTYIPVGRDAAPELMVTAAQREFLYYKVREYRKTKPLFTIDFWNDGEYIEGCIAGGRRYLHINANGDVEPCSFIHYADHNIHNSTLLEALQGPLFKAYQNNQPFNGNHLRPCPLLDNPERIAAMVETTGAQSTDFLAPENVRDLTAKTIPAARQWAITADRLWSCSGSCRDCSKKEAHAGM
ncbi:MAG: radical SAM protein [Syntrophomonadaceae bacterium]|nr:radical SAM protein [Syntrophomonadaceae bacterium]